jgi:hypothetical protein
MPKFKPLICGLLTLPLTACLDSSEETFFSTKLSDKNSKIEFLDIHQLNLAIGQLVNEIDESGFSPILKSHFTLKDLSDGPWPQSWVAFNIGIYLEDEVLAHMSKANVMQDHTLTVTFEQPLPRFGIKQNELSIRVTPVAWMPTFPLNIVSDSLPKKAGITSLYKQRINE